MRAELKIKRHILKSMVSQEQIDSSNFDLSTEDGICMAWDAAREYEGIFSKTEIIDDESEFRCSGDDCGLECNASSRHYEVDRVAKKLSCGSYVSWLYWYGGGKHGEPDMVDWMEDAIEVDCKEEEKLVIVRTYSLIEDA